MIIDFSKLEGSSASDTVIEPRKIFTSLPDKHSKYNYPRDVQTQVLDKWFERRSEKDLVIKMNTGSGKTVVGLLILKSSLNEMRSPAVYVVPDKYLVQQVVEEAKKLGVLAVESESDSSFLSGKAILICTAAKLFNGRSTFGVAEEGEKIRIGSIIVDDAHSCISIIREKFTLKLKSTDPIYSSLLKIFDVELERYNRPAYLDIKSGDPNALLQIPFWMWKTKEAEIVRVLHASRNAGELIFTWNFLKEILPLCLCTFSGTSIEITPRHVPVDLIPSFFNASRRIYMTATLADDSVLVSDFMSDVTSISRVITPNSADDLGDRMILAPQELNPLIDDNQIKQYLTKIAVRLNVVVIVPSKKRAEYWSDVARQTLLSENLVEGVNNLKVGHVGLTVLVNRYDGIDLPDDACRLLVIDGLPEVQGLTERAESSILEGSDAYIAKQLQKIEQGMGRGVRNNKDYCAVILLGSKLTQRLHGVVARNTFSPATAAQFELSRQVAKQLIGKSMDEISQVVELCLSQDHQWVSASKGSLVSVKPIENAKIEPLAKKSRDAFEAARINQYQHSVSSIQSIINETHEAKLRGYLKLIKAEYLQHINPVEAQAALLSAVTDNRRVPKPIQGIFYNKLSHSTISQVSTIILNLRKFRSANDYIVHVNSILEDLNFSQNTSEEFETALGDLGELLGFETQRPEKEYYKGPDNLWAIGNLTYFVIECKNGVVTPFISKHDCDQLSGSVNWFNENYDSSCTAFPIMIHPSFRTHKQASAISGMRVINSDKLIYMKDCILKFSIAISSIWGTWDETAVAKLLDQFHLAHNKIISSFTLETRQE